MAQTRDHRVVSDLNKHKTQLPQSTNTKITQNSLQASITSLQTSLTTLETELRETKSKLQHDPSLTVKRHIRLLHEYNEIKDVAQGLMGLIAAARGLRVVEVQKEFGVKEGD